MIYPADCGSRRGPGRVKSESCVAVLNKKLFSAFFNPSGARFSKVPVIFAALKVARLDFLGLIPPKFEH